MAILTRKKAAKPPHRAAPSRAPGDPMNQLHLLVVLVIVALLLAMLLLLPPGCGRTPTEEPVAAPAPADTVPHGLDAARVARGAQVYRAHCATCHGASAEGAPNWHRPGADGKYPAPPLDGTGHAWHHPKDALVRTVREGTLKLGGSMPGWKDKLGNDDIEAAIAWFQSRWPEDVYKGWALMDAKARRGG